MNKRLSIEEKAKAYDIALDKIKMLLGTGSSCSREELEYVFPELAESEDERMIQYFKDLAPFDKAEELYEKYGFSHKDAIAWLEKQGEHANFRNKIQIGDKVTRNEDGVLVNLSQLNRVAKKDEKQGEQKQELLTKEKALKNSPFVEQKPAEKFPKYKKGDILTDGKNKYEVLSWDYTETGIAAYYMKGAGCKFSWNCEEVDKKLYIVEQKPAWNEEDENIIRLSIENLTELEDRYGKEYGQVGDCIDWLNSLRPHKQWKPSDEQMELIKDIVFKDRQKITRKELAIFHSIYNDLKKLREE